MRLTKIRPCCCNGVSLFNNNKTPSFWWYCHSCLWQIRIKNMGVKYSINMPHILICSLFHWAVCLLSAMIAGTHRHPIAQIPEPATSCVWVYHMNNETDMCRWCHSEILINNIWNINIELLVSKWFEFLNRCSTHQRLHQSYVLGLRTYYHVHFYIDMHLVQAVDTVSRERKGSYLLPRQ